MVRHAMVLSAVLGGLAFSAVAIAGDPEVESTTEADGTIQLEVVLPASSEEVRIHLADAEQMSRLSPDVLDVQVLNMGHCVEVRRQTRGLFRALSQRVMRCPTETGWTEALMVPGDYTSYASEWKVVDVEGGSRISFRIKTGVNLPVPNALVQSEVQGASKKTLLRLVKQILTGKR